MMFRIQNPLSLKIESAKEALGPFLASPRPGWALVAQFLLDTKELVVLRQPAETQNREPGRIHSHSSLQSPLDPQIVID